MNGKVGPSIMEGLRNAVQSLSSKIDFLVRVVSHSLLAKTLLEDAVLAPTSSLKYRRDIIFSHAIIGLVTLFSIFPL